MLADISARFVNLPADQIDREIENGWRITGKGGAAETLGLKRTTLPSKLKKLGIRRPAP
jgi:hypothetical protein